MSLKPSALPGGSPATIAALRDVLGIELLQAALATPYANQALGEAGTTTGDYFAVDAGGGTVSIYGLTSGTGVSITGASPITGAGSWLLTLSANLQGWSGIDPASKSDTGHSHTFASLTSKPTTLAGYGINDAAALSHSHTFASLTSKPTTIAGYGIVDAASLSSFSASSGSSLVGFIRTGTGATARTLEARGRDWVSVKDYGALGDGVTDDRARIVDADAAAFAAGKDLFFPAGTYMVSSHITGLKASWRGETGSKVKATSGLVLNLEAMLTWNSASNFVIKDIEFDLQSRPATVGSESVLGFSACSAFTVDRCRVINLTGCGIAMNACQRATIHGCFISKAAMSTTFNEAILTSSSAGVCREVRITNNRLLNSGMDLSCIDCWVERNYISGWGFGAGITTEAEVNKSLRYRIIDNVIEDSNTAADSNAYRPGGIENWGPYSVIAGNHIANCAGAGIDQGGAYTVVRDNIVLNNGTSGTDSTPGPQVPGGDGISSRYGDATYNSSYSTYANNYVADTRAPGDKLQAYGYREQSASLVGIQLYGNRYDSNLLGEESIVGSGGWYSRFVTATADWKWSTTGVGKLEFTCPVLFTGAVTFSALTTTTTVTAGTDVIVTSGNRVKLQGAANLTGIRYQSSNVEIFVGPSYAAGFGTNTVGFCGSGPVTKPTITGSRGGNAALASLLTQLASTGLITDSTTA